ncbi:iron ABC transporter [Paraphotobacterium marinum]|uniref:Iron ABC transporter n=1 Tax=Paraphotobacterium marinum TaxID=1755811 RepID=A0A220VES7_9GAMM|nr:ATP-binding cassette domain-containing protein [Paraphotobacterium marinum]ASK78801.1 iron ABC transporter [Paraphotobacterium marinum]
MNSLIFVNGLEVKERLEQISFSIEANEIVHIIGPNGSGKSTLIHCLSGLFLGANKIFLNQKALSNYSLNELSYLRSYLSTSSRPVFPVKVLEFLKLTASAISNVTEKEKEKVVLEIAHKLDLEDKLLRNINKLSDGEWQRIKIASSIIQVWPDINPHAKYILLDEPMTYLDVKQQIETYKLLDNLKTKGVTIIMSNHDLLKTKNFSDKVILMSKGQCINFELTEKLMHPVILKKAYHLEFDHNFNINN